MAKEEQGRDFSPPIVPRSISLVNEVVKVRILAKNKITHSAADVTSGPKVKPPFHAKLQIKIEPAVKARIERISYALLNST